MLRWLIASVCVSGTLEEPSSNEDAPLDVDRLSNVVRRGGFLGWSSCYGTAPGLKPQPQVEIAVPHGAFSGSLRTANDRPRIVLNIGEGGATGFSRFLDAFGGAINQQIALSTGAVDAEKRGEAAFE